MNLDNSLIFWNRVAEPQSDQYDTMITLEFAHRRGYVRRGTDGEPTFFDGKVAIRPAPGSFSLAPDCVPASHDHPNVERACNLVRLWPQVYTQCQLLIESVSLFVNIRNPVDDVAGGISNSIEGFGSGKIASIVNNHVGFAEALVHEMAHHKLCTLGVQLESAGRIIKNPPTQKFKSPIRHDCLRPMTAVLHAQYSFTYVAALDIEIIKAGKEPARDRLIAERQLADKLPKLQFGLKVIKDNADLDSAGADFLEGYVIWLNRVLEEGYRILNEFQIPPKTFIYPLETQENTAQQKEQVAARQHFNTPDGVPHVDFHDEAQDIRKDSINMACIWTCRLNDVKKYSLPDEIMLYFPEHEKAFVLNSSATSIWELCDGKRTIVQISQELGQRFGCCGDELLHDVIDAITQLRKHGLLKLEETPPTKHP